MLDAIATQRLSPCGARALASVLSPDNADAVLEQAAGKTVREIERLAAALAPKPDVPPRVRRAPSPAPEGPDPRPGLFDPTLTAPELSPAPEADASAPARPRPAPSARAPRPEPLRPDRYKVAFTTDGAFVAKLEEVQALLSHAHPGADVGEVLTLALDCLLDVERNKRRPAAAKPRKARRGQETTPSAAADTAPSPKPEGRHIPAEVQREVWQRDEARCTFTDAEGRRCGATHFLELHHVQPWALGGSHRIDNLELRCKSHNLHAARHDFGPEAIDRHIARGRSRSEVDGAVAGGTQVFT